jgi:hypothetical protein
MYSETIVLERDDASLTRHFRHVGQPPSLRFVRVMLQVVAAGVRVSLVSDPEGKDDVAARAGGLGEGVAE